MLIAREDAIRVKRFIRSSDPNRAREADDDEPTPTQRASGSLEAVRRFLGSISTLDLISSCIYYISWLSLRRALLPVVMW